MYLRDRIAQSLACRNQRPYVRSWLGYIFCVVHHEKISKAILDIVGQLVVTGEYMYTYLIHEVQVTLLQSLKGSSTVHQNILTCIDKCCLIQNSARYIFQISMQLVPRFKLILTIKKRLDIDILYQVV